MFGLLFWKDSQLLYVEELLIGPGGCMRTRQEAVAAGPPVSLTHYSFLSTKLPQPTLAPLIPIPSFLYHFSFSDPSGFLYDSSSLPQFSSVVILQERGYLNLSALLCYLGRGLAAGQPGRGPCSCLDWL